MPEDVGGVGHGQGPVLIKRIQKAGQGHHGGAWKVAYADMVTALMAFFIVLWILTQSEAVIHNVAGYFRDPVGFLQGGSPSVLEGAAATDLPLSVGEPPAAQQQPPTPGEQQRWRERAGKIRDALEGLPSFARYRDQIEISLTPEGMRITLLESNETPLFETGGTELNPDARGLLATIGEEIASLPNHVAIEGHTDSKPFVDGSSMTNWELSTGRAQTARRVLEQSGLSPGRIFEIRGLADRQLYAPDDPEDSRNRRVAITLLSDEAHQSRLEQNRPESILEMPRSASPRRALDGGSQSPPLAIPADAASTAKGTR